MAEGRGRAEWARTSLLAALIANANRDSKKKPKPFTPDDFSPFTRKSKSEVVPVSTQTGMSVLKTLFVGQPQKGTRHG